MLFVILIAKIFVRPVSMILLIDFTDSNFSKVIFLGKKQIFIGCNVVWMVSSAIINTLKAMVNALSTYSLANPLESDTLTGDKFCDY